MRWALVAVAACRFTPGVPAASTNDAPRADASSATCRDLIGMASGVYTLPSGDAYCDEDTDGGGWTLVATLVNADGARQWSSLAAFTGSTGFGSLAGRDTADYRSPLFAQLSGSDLMIVTDE